MNSTMRALASATSTKTTDRRGSASISLNSMAGPISSCSAVSVRVAVVLERREDVLAPYVPQRTLRDLM